MHLSWAVALGCSATVGLGVYTLLGEYIELSAYQTAPGYLVLLLFAAPFVLTYCERAVSLPGAGGAYQMSRTSGILWHRYFSGWMLLGGYATVVALLSWGIGLYLGAFLRIFDGPTDIAPDWLTAAGLASILLFTLASRRVNWRQRVNVIFAAMGILLLISLLGVLAPVDAGSAFAYRKPSASMLSVVTLMMSSLWGLHLVLGIRAQLQRPTKNMIWALALPVAALGVLGMLAALAVGRTAGVLTFPELPLLDVIVALTFLPNGITAMLLLAFAFGMNLLAASRVLVAGNQLLEGMARDGFLPEVLQRFGAITNPAAAAIGLGGLVALVLVLLIPVQTLASLSAILFLWSAALIHAPDLIRSAPNLPPKRPFRLPFHPLFPGITIATGLLLPVSLPFEMIFYAAIWLAAGTLYYILYARKHGRSARRQLVVVDDESVAKIGADSAAEAAETFTVIVGVAHPGTAVARLRLAGKLASPHGGQVLALKVVDLPEYGNQVGWHRVAESEWHALAKQLSQEEFGDVPVKPIVRLASSYSAGLLEAVHEENAAWLLVGWTEESPETDDDFSGSVLNEIVAYADCNVGVLRGLPPADLDQIVVATAGGDHAAAGLELALAAVNQAEGKVHLVNVVHGVSAPDLTEEADALLARTRMAASAQGVDDVHTSVINAPTVAGGIGARYRDADLLIVGASKIDMPERSYFGGLAKTLVEQDDRPAMLVRKVEAVRFPSVRRNRDRLANLLPALTHERRAAVRRQMRSSALPTVDFFVLIVLSAIIATLGLLQNSGAVIIGAMLVAPLMSPILAIGMGMAVGEGQTIQNGFESTLKGMGMAIVVAALVTIISPIDSATNEILARTSPNLLDLMVALASGAAAGYAISRKEVAAALPGVAIAAALVPPLCVVGYGLGMSNLDIAAGAMLLFTTNLIAIIFAAAMTFLALGFHPPRAARGNLARSLRLTILSLAAIAVVLIVATVTTVRQERVRQAVDATFARLVDERSARIVEVSVQRNLNGHLITATVISFPDGDLTAVTLGELEAALEDAVGGPIEMDVTVLQGWRDDLANIDKRVMLTGMLEEEIAESGGTVSVAESSFEAGQYTIKATILVYDGHTLTVEVMRALQEEMSVAVAAPVLLETTYLQAVHAELDAPTPTPDP